MELTVMIGIIGTILGGVLSYAAFARNRANDNRDEGRQGGVIFTELGYIKANTDEIKAEQKEQRKSVSEIQARLAKVEGAVDRAHSRVDHVEMLMDSMKGAK